MLASKTARIGIILARSGSKRITNKNIVELGGSPLITWTINACKKSGCFDKILVSTDCKNIADIAISAGADVPFLRNSAFDDYSTSSEATIVALEQAEQYWRRTFPVVAQLMACCPFRNESDIKKTIKEFDSKNYISLISCSRFTHNNPWWAFQKDKTSEPKYIFKNKKEFRSQDLPTLYCPNGAIWVSKRNNLIKNNTFYSKNHKYFELSWRSGFDIDEPEDLELARSIF